MSHHHRAQTWLHTVPGKDGCQGCVQAKRLNAFRAQKGESVRKLGRPRGQTVVSTVRCPPGSVCPTFP